jgi:protein SYS1
MAGSSGIAVSLGMWGCRYRELKPISFGGIGGGSGATGNGEGSSTGENGALTGGDGDEELGYSRGRGRGRGRDGGGDYEMVHMKGSTAE